MKKFVRIQSKINTYVNPGITYTDVTNPDAHVPDRLKINPTWAKARVLIKAGVGVYPAEIAEWNTTRALAQNGVLTIGETIDEEAADDEAVATKANLDRALADIKLKSTPKKKKGTTLAEAAQ